MKKYILALVVLVGLFASASAQYKYTVGAFYKDFHPGASSTLASNYIQVGLLPPNAAIISIRVYSISNTSVITNCLLNVGIVSSTNYFINNLQIGVGSLVEQAVTAVSNSGYSLSTSVPTPIYARYVYNGVAGTTNFLFRVLVNYVQR